MKPSHTLRNFLALAGSSLLAVSASAATLTWDADTGTSGAQDGGGNWTVGGTNFWDGTTNVATINDIITDIARFGNGGTLASPAAVNVSSQSITGLIFGATTTSGYNLTASTTGQILTLGASGITLNSGAQATTVGSADLGLTLGAAQSWTNNSASLLTVSGAVVNGGNLLTVSGAGSTSVSSIISGTGGLTKSGAGILTLSNADTYSGATSVNAGTLKLTGARTTAAGQITVQAGGILEVNNASLNFSLGTNSFILGANGGTSTVNHLAGKITLGGSGNAVLIGNGATGEYNLSGGTLSINYSGTTGRRGVMLGVNSNSTATFNLSGTGLLEMTNSRSALIIGRNDSVLSGLTTEFNQTGGEAKIQQLKIGGVIGATDIISKLTLTGGIFRAEVFNALGEASLGTNLTTITIGGTANVTLPAFRANKAANHTVNVIFDGGVLKNLSTSTDYFGNITSAQIKNGGAKFDTTGGSITIIEPFENFSGQTGKLTKEGTNTLTLAGASIYTGDTIINGGTLALGASGSIANSSVITVGNGAILDVSAVTGGWTLGSGKTLAGTGTVTGAATVTGSIAPGTTGIGTLNVGAVTWKGAASAGSATDWKFNLGASDTADLLNITGNFTKDTAAGSNFRFDFLNSAVAGTFDLITWTGTNGFSAGDFSFTNLGAGTSGSFTITGGNTLQFISVIPEPSTAFAGLLLTAGLLRRRRK